MKLVDLRKYSPWLFLILLPLVVSPLLGKTDSEHRPRQRLRERGYKLSGNQFLYAASAGDTPALKLFLQSNLKVNDFYADGRTPLMGAVQYADTPTVEFLLNHGAELDRTDPDGETALFYAVRGGRDMMAYYLLEAGADPSHPNNQGVRPAELARRLNHAGIAALINARIRRQSQPDSPDETWYRIQGGPDWMRGLRASRERKNLGSADAPLEITVYVDFQCPYCRKFSREVLPRIARRYVRSGVVQLRVRHFPLPMHNRADEAANAAECAADQQRFWRYEHALVKGTSDFSRRFLLEAGRSVGVENFRRFRQCVVEGMNRQAVFEERGRGIQAGVRMTPTVVVGDTTVQGYHPYEHYRAHIKQQLQKLADSKNAPDTA